MFMFIATLHPCEHFLCYIRWPWPLFKIIGAPSDVSSPVRRELAVELLQTDDRLLESSTRKIKKVYMHDFKDISETGKLRVGCGLHKFLTCVAMNLKLDSGSLESLNSMIRQAINISNNVNISLELLSARVNTRKTITLQANGSKRLRDVKPIAEQLASSCVLYQHEMIHVLDDVNRWSPAQPVLGNGRYSTGDPQIYDPQTILSTQQRWAFRFHRTLMKALTKLSKDNLLVGFGLCPADPTAPNAPDVTATYLVAEITGRVCQIIKVELTGSTCSDGGFEANLESPLKFVISLDVLASLHAPASNYKPGFKVETVFMKYADRIPDYTVSHKRDACLSTYEANKIRLSVFGTGETHTIKYRKEYTKKQQDVIPAASGGTAPAPGDVDSNASKDPQRTDAICDENIDDAMSNATEDSIDSIQAKDELELLEHELQGDYSDDDNVENDNVDVDHDHVNHTNDNQQNSENSDAEGEVIPDHHLLSAAEHADLNEMQDSNNRLLAAAAHLQEQTSFCDFQSIDVPDGIRPYDDEVGEAIFKEYVNHKNAADGTNPNQSSSSPTKRHKQSHGPTLDQVALQVAFDRWTSAAQSSARTCEELCSHCKKFDGDNVASSLGHELSLVLHDGANDTAVVSLVTWVTPYAKLLGRSVRLDEDDCVIYPSHFVEKRSFTSSVMVLHTTGARVRKQAREKVPTNVLRARDMIETAIDGLAGLPTSFETTRCSACRTSAGDDMDMFRCSFCLLWWHPECSQQLAKRLPSFMQTHGTQLLELYDLTLETMPFTYWWLCLENI